MCTLQAFHNHSEQLYIACLSGEACPQEGPAAWRVPVSSFQSTSCADGAGPRLGPVEALSHGRLCGPCFLAATSTTWSMSAKDTSATASQLVSTLKLSCRDWARFAGTALISGPCTMDALRETWNTTVRLQHAAESRPDFQKDSCLHISEKKRGPREQERSRLVCMPIQETAPIISLFIEILS